MSDWVCAASPMCICVNITLPSHCPTVGSVWWEVEAGLSFPFLGAWGWGSHMTRASLSLNGRPLDIGSSKGLWLLRLISPRGWEEVHNRPALLDGVCPPGSTRTELAQGAPVRRQWEFSFRE